MAFTEREYYENSEVVKTEIPHNRRGRPHGDKRYFYPNGRLEKRIPHDDGLEDGDEVGFYETGESKYTLTWKKGKKEGPEIGTYKSGNRKYDRLWKNNKKIGLQAGYYDNEKRSIFCFIPYVNDEAHGIGIYYRPNGSKCMLVWYSHGKTKKVIRLDENGHIISDNKENKKVYKAKIGQIISNKLKKEYKKRDRAR